MKQLPTIRTSKTLRGFMLNMIVVFTISFSLLIVMYIIMLFRMRNEAINSRNLAAEQFKASIDSQIYNIKLFSGVFTSDRDMFDFILDDAMLLGKANGKQFDTLWNLSRNLTGISYTVTALQSAYIYCIDLDKVLSTNGISSSYNYYRITYRTDNGYSQWKDWLDNSQGESLVYVPSGGDGYPNSNLSYISTITLNPENRICVALNLDNSLLNTHANALATQGSLIAITSMGGNLVYTNSPLFLDVDFGKDGISRTISINTSAGKMMLGSYYSAQTGCTYHVLTPYRIFYDQVYTLQSFGIAAILAIAFISLSLVYFLARRAYRPIGVIVDALKTRLRSDEAYLEDEYAYIHSVIDRIADDNSSMQSQLYRNNNQLRDLMISRLMYGRYDNESVLRRELENADVHIDNNSFMVMLAWSDAYYDMDNEEANLIQYVVCNVFGELLEEFFSAYPIVMDGKTGILICIPEQMSEHDVFDILEALCERGREFFLETFQLQLFIVSSNCHKQYFGINNAYNEAETLMALANHEQPVILLRDEMRHEKSALKFMAESHDKIANLILTGDLQSARQIINEEVSQTIKQNPGWKSEMVCFDICLLLMKILLTENLEQSEIAEIDAEISELMNNRRLSVETLGKLSEIISSHIRVRSKRASTDTLEPDVKQYISLNYHDPSLSTGDIADHLGLHVNYLSSLYKKKTGESILDIISIYRISHAKELLRSTSKKVDEIALLSGYQNSQSFFRVFKKLEGVTPNQYRAMTK